MELLIAAAVLGIILGVAVWIVIWRATGTAFDWLIETFGNRDAAERVRKRRNGL
ncbi:MAG: hypothetical protein M3346_00395 [Actinomycetota bacterium]|nr:hypothetical protein [Actinomycetota bacterium]